MIGFDLECPVNLALMAARAQKSSVAGGNAMQVFEIRGIAPDASTVALQAFARSWHFIERDPVLAGYDRDILKAQLSLEIQRAMAEGPHVNLVQIANRAIGRVREEMRERHSADAVLAS
jgi:hypothetical protein